MVFSLNNYPQKFNTFTSDDQQYFLDQAHDEALKINMELEKRRQSNSQIVQEIIQETDLTNVLKEETDKQDSHGYISHDIHSNSFAKIIHYIHRERAKELLEEGIHTNLHNEYGRKVLVRAIQQRNFEIIKLLIKHGVDINLTDQDGNTPLIIAGDIGEKDIIHFLLQNGADPNKQNKDGNTVLMGKIWYGNTQSIQLLLESGSNLDIQNSKGLSALMYAILYGGGNSREAIKLLIANGVNINLTDIHGNTPLMLATYIGNSEAIQILIENKADTKRKNHKGKTALQESQSRGLTKMTSLLEQLDGKKHRTPKRYKPSFQKTSG